ncbi:MAG: hypothetical protein ABSH34_29585 [Verrucomicrobiota bacterium]|jgi:transposase
MVEPVREIARLLGLSRNTVRAIIGQGGAPPPPHPRADKQALDEESLRRLYQECRGHIARVHEKLVEEEGVARAYSTLTQRLRQLGISDPPKTRCQQVPDEPGAEMQHDTSVYPVELAGRRVRLIASLEDLNQQAFQWSTARLDNKPQGKAGLIPAQAFEHERAYLLPLAAHLPAPYKVQGRGTDQYGYVAFGANYYWVPGTRRDEVKLLEYSDRLKIYHAGECLAEYPLPADGVRNAKFSPQGQPAPPHHPQNRRHPTELEEKHLRALAPAVSAYLDYALPTKGLARHEFIRRLLALSRKMSVELFGQTLERARKYRITSLETLQNIAWLYLQQGPGQVPLVEIDAAFRQRQAYQEGCLTDPPELSADQDPPPSNHE